MFGGTAMGRPGGPAMNPGAWGVRPTPQVSQGPMNRPARPGLLGNPTPVSVPGVNPIPEYVPQLPDMYYPPQQQPKDPMSIYTTLTPPPAPPQSYFMAGRQRMPNAFDMAVQEPSYEGSWPGEYSSYGYNDPSLGTNDFQHMLGNYAGGSNFGAKGNRR